MRDLSISFAALADPTRLEMLALLIEHGELCVCDFVGALDISQSKASRHLRYLWHAGLLQDRRAGLWVYYRIAEDLAPDARVIVQALTSIFRSRDLSDLESRLKKWLKTKSSAGACKVPEPRSDQRPALAPRHSRRRIGEVSARKEELR
jgi:ArsR family transcriptional regulator, arsenate/arsenite/antimonite-responsive transcriptional repressor